MSARKKAKRPGRQPMPGGREKFTTTLPAYVIKHLRKIGGDNASAGICLLVDRDISSLGDQHD